MISTCEETPLSMCGANIASLEKLNQILRCPANDLIRYVDMMGVKLWGQYYQQLERQLSEVRNKTLRSSGFNIRKVHVLKR